MSAGAPSAARCPRRGGHAATSATCGTGPRAAVTSRGHVVERHAFADTPRETDVKGRARALAKPCANRREGGAHAWQPCPVRRPRRRAGEVMRDSALLQPVKNGRLNLRKRPVFRVPSQLWWALVGGCGGVWRGTAPAAVTDASRLSTPSNRCAVGAGLRILANFANLPQSMSHVARSLLGNGRSHWG